MAKGTKIKAATRKVKKAAKKAAETLTAFNLDEFAKPALAPGAPMPDHAQLDALAAIAHRADLMVKHGPAAQIDFEDRVRARMNTPGLREWIAARLHS